MKYQLISSFFCCIPFLNFIKTGGELWIGFAEWYYSIYHQPWEGVADAITRSLDRWQQCAKWMSLEWKAIRGSQPRFTLSSVLALTVDLICARSLPAKKQIKLLHPWNRLWMACGYSGRLNFGTYTLEVDGGKVNKASILQAWLDLFPDLNVKLFVVVLDKMQAQTLLGIAVGAIRCCTLHPCWPQRVLQIWTICFMMYTNLMAIYQDGTLRML